MPTNTGRRTNWARNFGRSVKFSAVEILGDLAPSTKDTAQNASGVIQDLLKDLKGLRVGQNKIMQEMNKIPAFKYAKEWKKNAWRDLQSGKFNNQERLQRMADADLDNMDDFGGDDDFSFSADDTDMDFSPGPEGGSDSGGDEDFSVAGDVSEGVKPVVDGLQPGIHATANAARHTAIAAENFAIGQEKQSKMIAEGFESGNKLAAQIATSSLAMQQQFHSENLNVFNQIGDNTAKLVQFNDETMSKLAMGALKFYDDQLSATNSILSEIQQIRQHVVPEKGKEEEAEEAPQASQLFTGRGVFKMGKYPEILKKNFMAAADEDMILSTIKTFLTDETTLKAIAANPLQFVTTKIVTNLIPDLVKNTMKELDTTIAGFFPALFAKINSGLDSDNPLKQLFAKIFGIRTDVSTSADFAAYEKGAVPFDGITRTAITTVIPNYLSQILAALTGREEQTFDFEKGTFTTKQALFDRQREEELSRLTSPYSRVISDIRKMLDDDINFKDDREKRVLLDEDLIEIFKNITLGQKAIDINKTDTFTSLGASNTANANAIQAAFKKLSYGKQVGIFNSMFKAGIEENDYYTKALKENPAALMNLLATQGGLGFDQHLIRDDNNKAIYRVAKGGSPFSPLDEFGKSQLDYLRDIKDILINGVITYPKYSAGGEGNPGGIDPSILERVEKWKEQKDRDKKTRDDYENSLLPTKTSAEEFAEGKREGRIELRQFARNQAEAAIQLSAKEDAKENPDKKKMGGIYEWFDKNTAGIDNKVDSIKKSIGNFLKTPVDYVVGKMRDLDKFLYTVIYGDPDTGEGIVKTTIDSIKKTFTDFGEWAKKKYNDVSKWLFGENGITDTKAYKWIAEKSGELFDYLFGKKDSNGNRSGGAFSGSFNALKDFGYSIRSELFGTSYKDSEGKEHGENKNSVMHNIKTGVSDALSAMNEYLFGPSKKNPDGSKKSFIDNMTDTLGEGFTNWKNFFFGTKTSAEDGKSEFKSIVEDTKKAMPKALAVGIVGAGVGMFTNFGLLGSLFLPGGPIGGAILGTAVGLLGQSEKFKEFLFGPKGIDGARTGGIISKGVMDWVTAHKTALLGGATFGAVKGLLGASGVLNLFGPLGYMANFLLPGGPIGGALLGAAVGIGWKSKTFQEFLYGKEGQDGKKIGGILNTKMGEGMKKHLPNMAFGAASFGIGGAILGQMGFMGAMLTPGGPLGMAILGAAAGFGISSEKFRKFLFGDIDEATGAKKKAGLFDKVKNVFTLEIAAPFKLQLERMSENIRFWFVEKISVPFKAALTPLQKQFKLMISDMKDMFKSGWKYFTDTLDGVFERAVGLPLAKFFTEKVLNPMKSFMNKMFNGIGRLFGAILSSPVKAMSWMANSFIDRVEQRGVKERREERKSIFSDRLSAFGSAVKRSITGQTDEEVDENGNPKPGAPAKGVWESLKDVASAAKDVVKGYGTKQTEEDKKKYTNEYDENGNVIGNWAEESRRVAEEETRKNREEHDKRLAELDAKAKDIENRSEIAREKNYEMAILDKDGNVIADISDIYNLDKPLSEIAIRTDTSNGLLDQIKKILANIGFKLTGDKNIIDYADKPVKPGTVAPTPKVSSDDEKHGKIAEEVKKEQDEQAEQNKITEGNVLGEEQTPGAPATAASSKPKKFSLKRFFGEGFKFQFKTDEDISKFIDMLPKVGEVSAEEYSHIQSVADRLISRYTNRGNRQATASTEQVPGALAANQTTTTTASMTQTPQQAQAQTSKQERAAENAASVAESTEDREFDSKKGIGKGGNDVLKYLRIIASNVDGQLDGVGSNVYKSRRLLETIAGTSSDDLTGSNNRDRKGILGKIRGVVFDMIFNPIKFVGNLITKPFNILFDTSKKIWNGMWNVIGGVKDAVVGVATTVWDAAKSVGKTLLKIPEMGIELIGTALDVTKEAAKAGIKVIGEGLVGVTKSVFKIVEGAGKAIGKITEGIGKGLGSLFAGLGSVAKGVMEGVGEAIGGTVDIISTLGGTMIEVGGAIAKSITDIATTTLEQVTKLGTKLISGVGSLIASAAGTLYSIATSPFKFLGKMGSSLIQRSSHVIVDGGKLETVKTVEIVELVRRVDSIKTPLNTGESIPGGTESTPIEGEDEAGALAADQKSNAGSSLLDRAKARWANLRAKRKGRRTSIQTPDVINLGSSKDTEDDDAKKEEAGDVANSEKKAASNVTADMAKSGLVPVGNGPVQRTAAMTKAVEESNEEKKATIAAQQKTAENTGTLVDQGKKRESWLSKIWQWLVAAGLWLKSKFGDLLGLLGKLSLGKIMSNLKDVLKEKFKNITKWIMDSKPFRLISHAAQDAVRWISEKAANAFKYLKTHLFDKVAETKPYKYISDKLSKLGDGVKAIKDRIFKKGTEEIAEDATKAAAETAAKKAETKAVAEVVEDGAEIAARRLPPPKVPLLPAPKNVPATVPSGGSVAEVATETTAKKAGGIAAESAADDVIELVLNPKTGVYEAAAEKGTASIAESQEVLSKSAAEAAGKETPKWVNFIKEAISTIEEFVGKALNKKVSFASNLWAKISKNLTKDVMIKNAGKLAAAEAKGAAGDASFGIGYAVFAVWNTATGLHDAANLFKVNAEAVTVPMRICAAVIRVILGWPTIPMCLLDVALLIIGALVGWNPHGWFAQALYEFISDEKRVEELHQKQQAFVEEARQAGYTKKDDEGNEYVDVDAYNEEVNKSVFTKIGEGWDSFKNAVGNEVDYVSNGVSNNLAWLFGQNNAETGEFEQGAIANAGDYIKNGIDNNLAWLFGQNNWETGEFEQGAIASTFDSVKETISKGIDNNLAWFFGQNNWETGEYEGGFLSRVVDAVDNELDYIFGKVDPNTGEVSESPLWADVNDWFGRKTDPKSPEFFLNPLVDGWVGAMNWFARKTDPNHPEFIFRGLGDWFARKTDPNNPEFVLNPLIDGWVGAMNWFARKTDPNHEEFFLKSISEWFARKTDPNHEEFVMKPFIDGWTGTVDWFSRKTDPNHEEFFLNPIREAFNSLANSVKTAYDAIMKKIDELRKWWDELDIKEEAKGWLKNILPESITKKSDVNYTGGRVHDSIEWIKDKKNQFLGQGVGGGDEDAKYIQTNYKSDYGFGKFDKAGCAPAILSRVLDESGYNTSPEALGKYAVDRGYRVPGGTTESFFGDAANQYGMKATKLNSFDDAVAAKRAGAKVIIGGKGSGYISGNPESGHYQELESASGRVFDPMKGEKSVSLDKLSQQTQTAYAFSGGGNEMFMPQQSTNKNCTLTATAALINAYKGTDFSSSNFGFGGGNWWYSAVKDLPATEKIFAPSEGSEFVSYLESNFGAKPEHPMLLYQVGGAGSSGGHPLNRGGGSHATVIGRKLADGTYEVYDSNGGMIHKLRADQIFDSSASGNSQGYGSGEGNILFNPQIDPSASIDSWKSSGKTSDETGSAPSSAKSSGSSSSSNRPKGIMDEVSSFVNGFFDAIQVGSTGRVWSPNSNNESGSNNSSGSAPTADVSGENAKDAWTYLRKVGFTEPEAAGIMGNFAAESGLDPQRVEGAGHKRAPEITVDGKTGYGLAQWTYITRQQNLLDYARSKGKSSGGLDTQLEFFWNEVQNYSTIGDMHKGNQDPATQAEIFMNTYEKPGIPHLDQRKANAEMFFNQFKGSGTEFTGSGPENNQSWSQMILGSIFNPTGIFGRQQTKNRPSIFNRKTKPKKNVEYDKAIAPNGKHYEKNDVDYLLKQGYKREDALWALSLDPKYAKSMEIGPNGLRYEKNDIDHLLSKGYTKEAAIDLLSKDKKYTEAISEKKADVATKNQPIAKMERKYGGLGGWIGGMLGLNPRNVDAKTAEEEKKRDESKFKRRHGGIFGWIGGMLGINKRDVPIEEEKKAAPSVKQLDHGPNAATLLGVTQADVSTFKGGEYFNDNSKVAMAARLYVKGAATLEDVAKAIGFDGIPENSTPLDVYQQQALGFTEYNPIRTWAHYVTASAVWKQGSGEVPVDRWLTGKANLDFFGSGTEMTPLQKRLMERRAQQVKDLISSGNYTRMTYTPKIAEPETGSSSVLLDTLNYFRRKHGKPEITGRAKWIGSDYYKKNNATPTTFLGVTQADVSTFKGGEYFNAYNKIAPEALAYVRGTGTLEDVAKALGFSEEPAGDQLLTAGMQQLLGFREYSPVRTWNHYLVESELWKNSGMTSAERWIKANTPAEKSQPSDFKPSVVDKISTESEVGKALEELRKVQEKQQKNESTDLFSKMVELLGAIASNTGGLSEGLKDIANAGRNPMILNASHGSERPLFIQHLNRNRMDKATQDAMSNPKASREYQRQLQIASGGEFVR